MRGDGGDVQGVTRQKSSDAAPAWKSKSKFQPNPVRG